MWRWRTALPSWGPSWTPPTPPGRQLHRPADRELRRPVCRQRHRRGDHPQLRNNLAKQTALIDLLYGQEGETPITDEELTDHLQNQMLYIRYTTVPLYDLSTFAFADEDQTAQMLDLAKQAAADSTPDTFDQVVADALPGIYAVLGTEITAEEAADQLNSSFISLSEMEGSFSDEDTQTLTGLAFGQSAAVQYGGTSLLIAMRMDPLETMTLDTLRGTILSDMGTSLVEADMDAAGAALSAD